MTYQEKIELAKKNNISIPSALADNKNLVGIYKILGRKDKNCICLYIGKSTDIAYRLLGAGDGHVYMYLKNNLRKLVPRLIDNYIKEGYEIEIEIIEIDYRDTSFSKAAHRLALAEISEIVKYQEMGQCLDQLPEGAGKNEKKFWEGKYKIKETTSRL